MAAAAAEGNHDETNTTTPILLNVRGYTSTHRRNATTAKSRTSNGHPIEVSFTTATPPILSHFSVQCPALEQQEPANYPYMVPKAIAADGQHFLFRMPVETIGLPYLSHNDYFVYTARPHPHPPRLDLIRKPSHDTLDDNEIAILSCGGDGEQYVVAALRTIICSTTTFTLHLYRSSSRDDGEEQGVWTCEEVSLEESAMTRDLVCPIPETANRQMHHVTSKVILLGGKNGTVGWVDLWRGILLCDVLLEDEEDSPRKVRDLPLPLPAKGNQRKFLNTSDDHYCRDVTVSRNKDIIKYVEMEIAPPRIVSTTPPGPRESDPFLEWIRCKERPDLKRSLVHGWWKATTWSMPIPVASWEDWRRDCTAKSTELTCASDDDNPPAYELLRAMCIDSYKDDDEEATSLLLGCLGMAYPAMSMDDDVIFLLTKPTSMERGKAAFLTAVDVRRKMVRAVAKLDSKKNSMFMRSYLTVRISKHFSATGSLGQAKEHVKKSARRRRPQGKA
uniref:DUF1618 domain-containing protein n=1 Tax=Leersia perrieri TaxID=77586 RepID=A0A0D9XK97_9ORYZ